MLIVDTNILIDVLQDDQEWADWSIQQLRSQAQIHELVINPIVYAELSLMYDSFESLDSVVAAMQLRLQELPRAALFLAGKAFVRYRREGGTSYLVESGRGPFDTSGKRRDFCRTKANVLADFFIGAHAAVAACPILTRDPRRYRSYFPTVKLLTPSEKRGGYFVNEAR